MTFLTTQRFDVNAATVWIATFDKRLAIDAVKPDLRNDYILAASDMQLRRQRYAVWRLLDYALHERLGKEADKLCFERQASGKWICTAQNVHFSLSHSDNAAAVAVSDFPVGVDIQREDAFCVNYDRFARRILSSEEFVYFSDLIKDDQIRYLAQQWTAKESVFKIYGDGIFLPAEVDGSTAVRLNAPSGYVAAVATK